MRVKAMRWLIGGLIALGVPAGAQLLPGLGSGPLGGLTGPLLGPPTAAPAPMLGAPVARSLDWLGGIARDASPASLLTLRRERLRALVDDYPRELDTDDHGNPIRRGEIVGIGLSPRSLAKALAAGFSLLRREAVSGIGIDLTVLAPPKHEHARDAIGKLRKLDPDGDYTLDPVYQPAYAALAPSEGKAARHGGSGGGAPIGLIDGGVGAHPAFKAVSIEQRGFAGDPKPSGHGTAVASLLVGHDGAFSGAAPGNPLLVADVYGGSPANGSAVAILRAMGWLASRGARVVNISLVGPPNPLLERGVRALQARGVIVVAAVGNDGPAAPPQYPASYPGVIAVTGVDGHDHVLIEAGKARHLDFAAPGADMVAAVPGGKWERVRGTSFAAPLVAGRLALADHGDAGAAIAAVAARARPGRDVGRGIVCEPCRTPPREMGLK